MDDVTWRKVTEVLVTVVATVRAMITHQGVRHVLNVIVAGERGRGWRQRSCAGKGRTVATPPARAVDVTRQKDVCHVPRRALHVRVVTQPGVRAP